MKTVKSSVIPYILIAIASFTLVRAVPDMMWLEWQKDSITHFILFYLGYIILAAVRYAYSDDRSLQNRRVHFGVLLLSIVIGAPIYESWKCFSLSAVSTICSVLAIWLTISEQK